MRYSTIKQDVEIWKNLHAGVSPKQIWFRMRLPSVGVVYKAVVRIRKNFHFYKFHVEQMGEIGRKKKVELLKFVP